MTSQSKLGRDVPALPLIVDHARDSYLFAADGRRYLDFDTGWCGVTGWNNRVAQAALHSYQGPAYVDPAYGYRPWDELAQILIEIAPGHMARAYRATGGTEAVEIALQAALRYTRKTRFISPEGYHGHSLAALSVGNACATTHFPPLLTCTKVDMPLDERAGAWVADEIAKGDVAAYISEPIICNQGLLAPTQEYFDRIQEACATYDTVFIIDEVATGFGRTGKLFASEYYQLKPDIVCLGKGLTGGYAALGATLMTTALAQVMETPFSFYSTWGWHPLNVHITLAYLKDLLVHRDELLAHIARLNAHITKRLQNLPWPCQAEVRSYGVAFAVEFAMHTYAHELRERCQQNGLLVGELGPDIMTLFPSGRMDMETAEVGLAILERSL